MRAIQIIKSGSPESLKIVELPIPEPREKEVLIKVFASGVNFADVLARQGLYPDSPDLPFVPGYETAGIVEKCGKNTDDFQPGDRVVGLTNFGGYAEYAVSPQIFTRKLDPSISFTAAASIPVNWITAYHCLFFTGPVNKDDKVLIHAAAGGVGSAVVQLLKNHGCYIIGTTGSNEKAEYLKDSGVDLVINYKEEDFADIVTKHFGRESIDIIIDSVGGDYYNKEWKLLRANGRIVSLGVASFSGRSKIYIMLFLLKKFRTNILKLLGNSQGVYGVNIRKIFVQRPDLAGAAFDEIMKLLKSGRINPVIDKVYALEDAYKAHRRLENGENTGKIILENKY
ncbi:zinc-binding alcohol dehydrogenase family protein [candidate division KSB1 bacterium]